MFEETIEIFGEFGSGSLPHYSNSPVHTKKKKKENRENPIPIYRSERRSVSESRFVSLRSRAADVVDDEIASGR